MSEDRDDADAFLDNSLNVLPLKNGSSDSTNTCRLQVSNGQRHGEHSNTKESNVKRRWSKSNANSDDSDASSLNNSMTTALAGLLCHSRSSSEFLSLQAHRSNSTQDVTSLAVSDDGDAYDVGNYGETANQDAKNCDEPHSRPKLFKFSADQSELFETTELRKRKGVDDKVPVDSQQLNASQNRNCNGMDIASAQRKLVLHFDIRNTILVADSVTNVSIEQALNTFLTGVTWGTDDKEWRWCSDHPSLTPPPNHPTRPMTYYKKLEKALVRIPSDRALLRQATGDFTSMPIGAKFRPYFEKHLKLLEWTYADENRPDKSSSNQSELISSKKPLDPILTISGSDGRPYHYILPSFLHMINALHAVGRNFCIVLRTFGMDASNVLAAAKRCIDGHHPGYKLPLPIKVYDIPGHVHRSCDGRISVDEPRSTSLSKDLPESPSITENSTKPETTNSNKNLMTSSQSASIMTSSPSDYTSTSYETERVIYERISQSTGISGYVDDFRYWQNDEYNHRSGKPLWIDLSDDRVHHIFFDDNIRVKEVDSIVDVRVFENSASLAKSSSCRSLSLEEIKKFENVCMVQADLLDSTCNMEYFLEKIKMCESNYERIINCEDNVWFHQSVAPPKS